MNTSTFSADSFSHSWLWMILLLAGLTFTGLGCGSAGGNGSGDGGSDGLSAPSNLSGESGNAVIRLDWGGTEEAESYNVIRDGGVVQSGVSETSFEDTDVENGTTYTYAVTAVGPEGEESDPSGTIKKTPFAEPPDTPGN